MCNIINMLSSRNMYTIYEKTVTLNGLLGLNTLKFSLYMKPTLYVESLYNSV